VDQGGELAPGIFIDPGLVDPSSPVAPASSDQIVPTVYDPITMF